jgi:hypothetical protein
MKRCHVRLALATLQSSTHDIHPQTRASEAGTDRQIFLHLITRFVLKQRVCISLFSYEPSNVVMLGSRNDWRL